MGKKNMANKTKMILGIVLAIVLAVSTAMFANTVPAMAAVSADDRGTIIILGARDGEEFTAYRIIDTRYKGEDPQSGAPILYREFTPAFSYGGADYDNRTDRGLDLYLETDDATAVAAALKSFEEQATAAETEEMARLAGIDVLTAVSKNGEAVFDDLPMGQYLITGKSLDENRTYQRMLGNLEPTLQGDVYALVPRTIDVKFTPASVDPPKIGVDKQADRDRVYAGSDLNYQVRVSNTGTVDVKNLHVTDELSADTISAGLQINRDVKIVRADGSEVTDATIVYTEPNGVCVGYTIDILGDFAAGEEITVTYSADTSSLSGETDVTNVARAWSDEIDPVESTSIVSPTLADDLPNPENPQSNKEGNDGGKKTPVEELISDPINALGELVQTGDVLPLIIGGFSIAAIIALIIVLVSRRGKRSAEE